MAGPRPNKIKTSSLKSKIMNLAQVSVYQIKFGNLPIGYNDYDKENIELLCESAELPGTSFMTHQQSNDYPGITEKFAYRRSYTQEIPLTFMVDREYKVIDFFDRWMDYINNNVSTSDMTFSYRMKYPDDYRADMFLTKFEKDAKGPSLEYKFLGAYPLSIDRMGVNYNNSNEILRCVVTMSFVRYVRGRDTAAQAGSTTDRIQNLLDNTDSEGNYNPKITDPILKAWENYTNDKPTGYNPKPTGPNAQRAEYM